MGTKLKEFQLLISVERWVKRIVKAESAEAAQAIFDDEDYMLSLGELRDDVCFVVDITELKDEDYMLDLGELRDDVCQVEKITELKDEPKRASRSHRRTARS